MTKVTDITERAEEFADFESKKVKIIILDGETGKVSLIDSPFHGDTVIETVRGSVRRVRFVDEHLLK